MVWGVALSMSRSGLPCERERKISSRVHMKTFLRLSRTLGSAQRMVVCWDQWNSYGCNTFPKIYKHNTNTLVLINTEIYIRILPMELGNCGRRDCSYQQSPNYRRY